MIVKTHKEFKMSFRRNISTQDMKMLKLKEITIVYKDVKFNSLALVEVILQQMLLLLNHKTRA